MGLFVDLDIESFRKVSSNAEQVMVYGFGHCKYLQLIHTLNVLEQSPVKRVFECSIGNNYDLPNYRLPDHVRTTSEGRLITQFKAEPLDKITDDNLYSEKFCTRVCKTGTINLIFENFLRKQQGLPVIPFIFAIDITNNKFPYHPAGFASQDPKLNGLVTHSEIRRCYKLACEFPDARIREIARETFRFVHVNVVDDKHILELKEPFWLDPGWKKAWEDRKNSPREFKLFKEQPWRAQLLQAIQKDDLKNDTMNANKKQKVVGESKTESPETPSIQ